jgi:hypothetical protein
VVGVLLFQADEGSHNEVVGWGDVAMVWVKQVAYDLMNPRWTNQSLEDIFQCRAELCLRNAPTKAEWYRLWHFDELQVVSSSEESIIVRYLKLKRKQ